MNNHKRILSLILALILTLSPFTTAFAQTKTPVEKTRTGAQEVQIGDEIYYIFSKDKNAKNDLIKSQEKSEKKTQAIQTSDGLDLSDNLFGRPVGAGRPASYTLNIKGNNFKGVGGKTFDWDTLPEGLELQVFYIDEEGFDYNVGNPITINKSNYQDVITRTFDIAGEPIGFGMKTNVDTETYLTDVYLTNEQAPDPSVASLNMTFDLVQVPSTKVDVKWVDVNQQPLARENTPATSLKDILTFNFIENKKFDLPNQDKVDSYFRLNNKIGRDEVKDIKGATAFVDSKKDGEEVTLDGKIYKLTTSYDPALNKGSKIQLMYMPDVIDRTKNPESLTPDKYVRVTIDAGEGTKLAQGESKKVYDVRIGKALKAEHYPKLEISDNAKYKEPITWTIAPGTAITKAENIKGNAAKTAAETITAANLKAVDTTALQGQDFPEKFWNDGVALADTVPADKKDAFAALLKDATVTDITNPARTTAEAGDKVGTLLVTFKDGSKLEVPNQKLIVKPNTVTVAFDMAAGKENPLRDGDTTVKGKITASSNSVKFPVSLDGAVVTIKKGNTVLTRTLANADGSFVAGVKDKLIAGEDISVVVTLPESKTESAPVTEKVQLNPDKLNEIIPTGNKVVGNLEGKKGVNQDLVKALNDAIKKANDELVENDGKVKSTVEVSSTGQKSLDDQYEAIKKAIEALTDNKVPTITGPDYKEIFKGENLDLHDGINVNDEDGQTDLVKQADNKLYIIAAEKVTDSGNVKVDDLTTIKDNVGTYKVTYTATDKSGATATHTMEVKVKDIVYTKIAVTTDPTTTKYLVKDKDTKAIVDYTGTVVTLTKNNGETETATYDKASGKFKIGDTAINELTITPAQVGVDESPAVITATYKAGKTELTAKAGKAIIVQIDSDGNGIADSEEKFDITKAKTMEITNQPTLNYELDHKTGKATLDLKPLVVKVTDSLGNSKYFGYDEIKSDAKFALALGTDAFDKAAAKELTTADTNKKVKVTLTYKESKTLEAETSAITVEDKRPSVIENPTPGEKREGYVSVTFNAGANGGLKGVNTFLVKKDTARSEVTVPTIVPAAGYKVQKANGGWDKAIPETFTADFTVTAQYELDEATSETEKPGYTPITFDALDKGKIGDARTKIIYVNPAKDVILSEKAPKVTANTGYSFKAWDPAIDTAKKYTKEERILATYTSDELISDKEKAGYIKVTFAQGEHGKFNETNPAQKTVYYVKPDTLVDLREKAPKLTPDAGYIHTGWSPDLVVNFKADAGDQTITAQYGLDSDYSTTKKDGYTKITFDKGTNGEFAEGAKTELWVNPAKAITLPAPGIVPNPGYSHTGWTKNGAAVELNTPAMYKADTTITAAYESDISDSQKDGYVKVSFDADKNGTIANNVKKDFWVNPNKEVNLTDKAPEVTPNSGYLFIKWDHKLVAKFEQATTIKATYASAGDIKTEQTDGFAHVKFDAGRYGSFATGATVEYWVNPDKAVVLPEPRVIANKDYEHTGWDPAITPAKQYSKDSTTTITATYNKLVSTEKVDGHQEIKFLAGNDGTFADGKKEISLWVKPDTLVDLRKSAPQVTVTAEGKTFTGWDKDLVGTFKLETENGQPKATVFKAQYSGSTSETPVPGWTEITFMAGEHGNFGTLNNTPIVEKKLWVDPKADVKLSDKAPKTIDDKNWSFDKWMDGQNPATGLDVAGKYAEAKTYTASYKSDISTTPQNGFVKVTFAPGTDGSFEQNATTEIYVRKDKEVDLTEKAPKVTANKGLSFKGWAINDSPVDLTKINVNTDTTITAQYTKAISDKEVDGWTRLQFNSGENGRFVKDAVTVKWVDPTVKLALKDVAPGIVPDKNYRLSAWNDGSADVELETEKLFEAPTTFTAKYEKISSETEIPGFTKISFNSGDHGNFGTKENNPVTEKNIWVNPKSEVKLSEIAPELVIDTNWSFDKWMDGQAAADMDTAKKYTEAKTYTATYESDFSDVAKKGFVKVEFLAGDHGKFEQVNGQDQITTIYVRKDKEIDITVKEPKVTPDNGYYFTGWDKPLQKVYTADTTHTGKNEKAIATEAVDGWTQITFNAGDKGLFKPDAKTVLWVKPNTKITLKDQVPGLEIQKGYSCIGWKKDAETNVTDLTVPATYDKSTTFTAAYESDFSKETKEGFIEVKFKAGDNGNFGKTTGASSTEVKDYSLWVRPDKEVDLTDQAPEITPHVGWKANGWDKTLTITVNAQTAEADRTFTAQYLKDDDVSDTKKEGYIEITFNAGDHGTFPNDAKTVKYVNPDSEIALSTIAPTVNPAINYSFKAWNNGTADVALDAKIKYTQATNYKATYESDISDTAKEGFVEVKFVAGTDGEFKQVNGVDQKTTFYVKKGKLVDLTDVAPTVTGKDKKTFTGWDSDLKRIFTDATTINAKYTESISDKYVEGWTQLDFDQGDHGRFVKGQKNVKWVDPAVDLKLDDIAPKINPDPNWSLKAWNDGTADVDGTKAQKFTKATTFTATYENAFSPGAKEGFVKVTFDQGAHGKFVKEAVKEIYVKKDVDLDLREKAPTVIPNQGWGHKGWTINGQANDLTKVKASDDTTIIKADYAEGTFDATKITKIVVLGPTQMGYGVGEKLNLDGLKVIAIDDAGLQETYDGVKNITAKGFTIEPTDKTELKMDDNGKHIVVTKVQGQDKVTGQTETTLTIHENKSAKAENVKALNQNIEENGKVTDKPKTTTTVTGKATPGSTVIIKDEAGNEIGKVEKVGNDGTFTAEVTKQEVGKTVKVIATEPGKQPSDPADAIVARDANNNKIADNKEQTERPAAIASNRGKTPTFTTIVGKTEPGAVITVTLKDGTKVKVDEFKIDTDGNYSLQATVGDKPLANGAEILVYAENKPKTISNPQTTTVFNDFNEDGKPDGGKVDLNDVKEIQVIAPKKMSYTQGEKLDGTGLKTVITDNKGGVEIFDYDNGTGKFKDADGKATDAITATVNGAAIKDLALTEKDHNGKAIDVKAGKMSGSTNQKLEVKQLQTPTPTDVFAANQNTVGSDGITPTQTEKAKTTVKFTVVNKPTTVFVKYTDNGVAKEESFDIGANDDATKTVDLQVKLPEGAVVQVLAKDADKTLSEAAIVTVVRDADNDGKADTKYLPAPTINPIKDKQATISGEAKDAETVDIYKKNKTTNEWELIKENENVSKDKFSYTNPSPFNDGDEIKVVAKRPNYVSAEATTTVGVDTSGLDKAIQDGKDALDPNKGGKNNGTPEDKALEDAIKKGEDLKKQDPAPTQDEVDKAQKDIEKAIEDKKAADDARDKLQEKINEANDKKNDPEYPNKPDDVKKELDDAAKDGQTTHDDKTKKKEDIDKEIEKIQEKIDQYNKQQLSVSITPPVAGTLKMELVTVPGNSKFKVYRGIVSEKNLIGEEITNSRGIGTITFDGNTVKLKKGMILRVVVEHDGYLSRTEIVRVI